MRRMAAIGAVATLMTFAMAGPAWAAKPAAPVVTSITITETGGAWPYCEQTATLGFTGGKARGTIVVTPYIEGGWAGEYWARVRSSGIVTIEISGADYSQSSPDQPDGWFWLIRTARFHSIGINQAITPTYDFDGACPAPGTILATGLLPLPWP